MSRHRGLLTIVGVFVLAGVSTLAAVDRWIRLPEPRTADRQGVLRWLATRDLEQEPPHVRAQLLERIEELFDEDEPRTAQLDDLSRLSPDRLALLRKNTSLLKEEWFQSKVDDFHACPVPRRTAFLDRHIKRIVTWAQVVERLSHDPGDARHTQEVGVLDTLFDRFTDWNERSSETRRQRVNSVVHAALLRWLATQDAAHESVATRRRLVRQIEQHFAAEPVSIGAIAADLPSAEQATFWRNVELLAETWFVDAARRYAELTDAQRAAQIVQWSGQLASLLEDSSTGGRSTGGRSSDASRGADLVLKIDAWTDSAPESDRAMLQRFARDLTATLFLRRLWGKFPN